MGTAPERSAVSKTDRQIAAKLAFRTRRLESCAVNGFFTELRRRKVYRVAAAYCVAAWSLIQFAATIFPVWDLPIWTLRFVIIVVLGGFPIALLLGWAFEVTPTGYPSNAGNSGACSDRQGPTPSAKEFALIGRRRAGHFRRRRCFDFAARGRTQSGEIDRRFAIRKFQR